MAMGAKHVWSYYSTHNSKILTAYLYMNFENKNVFSRNLWSRTYIANQILRTSDSKLS